MHIDLGTLYQELTTALHAAELRVAELRGQLQLIERLIRESQAQDAEMTRSGDALGEQSS